MIIIEKTECATSIGSFTGIKQHGDNGMDYFGITAGGVEGAEGGWGSISFSGMDQVTEE